MKLVRNSIRLMCAIIPCFSVAHAWTCSACASGYHTVGSPTITLNKTYYHLKAQAIEFSCATAKTKTSSATCSITGKNKYSLSGSLSYSAFGLSAGWDTEVEAKSECTSTASISGTWQCDNAYAGYTYKKTVETASYCESHDFQLLPFIYVTCDCAATGTQSGTLYSIQVVSCINGTCHAGALE